MSSVITVKLKYDDNSRSLTLSYPAADSDPPAEVIKDCEDQAIEKWICMGQTQRDMVIHTTVKRG